MEIQKRDIKDLKERIFPSQICFKPIGVLHSSFKDLKGIPIQFSQSDEEGIIEIFLEYIEGLKDLEGFSHIYCLYFFDMVKSSGPLQSKPFLDDEVRGVFAIRTPFRPNPIGLSILRILKIEGSQIFVKNIDMLDNTPIIDIKPYVSQFDAIQSEKNGWLTGKIREMKS